MGKLDAVYWSMLIKRRRAKAALVRAGKKVKNIPGFVAAYTEWGPGDSPIEPRVWITIVLSEKPDEETLKKFREIEGETVKFVINPEFHYNESSR